VLAETVHRNGLLCYIVINFYFSPVVLYIRRHLKDFRYYVLTEFHVRYCSLMISF
jgi:hypothetical protein